MRIILACLCCLTLAAALGEPPQTDASQLCTVSGRIFNEITGEPLRNVNITFQRGQAIYTTTSGDEGAYAVARLEPGSYLLSAEKTGFLKAGYGAKNWSQSGIPLKLQAGQNLPEVDLRLMPHGVIAGRVLDADGDPLSGASVQVLRTKYINGKRQLVATGTGTSGAFAMANDLGEFRVYGLPAGVYYVAASSASPSGVAVSDLGRMAADRSAKAAPEGFVTTYSPSSADAHNGSAIEVSAGQTVRGIEIRMTRARVSSVMGSVTNRTGSAAPVTVQLYSDDSVFNRMARPGPDGHFQIPNIPPGTYWIAASAPGERGRVYSVKRQIAVQGTSGENASLTLEAGVAVSGSIRIQDGDGRISARALRVSLEMEDPLPRAASMPPVNVAEDGAFTLDGLSPERYLVNVTGLPEGYYVKSIRLGDEDATTTAIEVGKNDVGEKTPALQIVVSGKAARLEGTAAASGATVVLAPGHSSLRGRARWYRTATADVQGTFTLAGLAPGNYKLFAWANVEDGAWLDPDFVKPFENAGTPVSIVEGGSEKVEINLR